MNSPINQLSAEEFSALEDLISLYLGRVFPALQLSVIYHSEWILNRAWGVIDPETQSPLVTIETLFDLASVSKLFTTSAFLALVSRKMVNLDDPLVTVIPEFGDLNPRPISETQDPHTEELFTLVDDVGDLFVDVRQVTFRHILTHTAGLAPWRAVFRVTDTIPAAPQEQETVSHQDRWENALQAICHYPFVDRIGRQIHYSDLGLMLLGEAVTRLSSVPLEVAIHKNITSSLGLASIQFNPMRHGVVQTNIAPTEDDTRWRKRRCWGEVHDENACSVGGVAGHAGLFGTAYDMARFGQAWLVESDNLPIESQWMHAAKQEQAASNGQRRGLGWMLKSTQDVPCGIHFSEASYGHTGFTGTSLWIDPTRQLVVACMTNRVYFGRDGQGILAFRQVLHDLLVKLIAP